MMMLSKVIFYFFQSFPLCLWKEEKDEEAAEEGRGGVHPKDTLKSDQ
jgi:hypothetical protein